ncbi:response regulator transcription factor [Clostridium sp. HCP1S3_B4]|uniref:response regulator transcription factor n=1 Tax=unclassified Clostridium TaxID=2614128 RepID=UPI00169410B3|nr:response regulator transcription factor [Clostridiales bacterium]MDY2729923.1 response regulator transcription factor [Clostridium sp.]NLK24100.1 response regulator transcription factor [Clostridiales bacterium]
MKRILIVEDNIDVNNMVREMLTNSQYEVFSAFNGIEAVKAIKKNTYDLVILDIMLPYKSGDEVLREIRQFTDIPVIILSAKDMVSTKIDLLKLGADDYITKPFDLGELVARVNVLFRRIDKNVKKDNLIRYKDITLDGNLKNVFINNNKLELTAKEYLIMELFMKNKERIFSKEAIYEAVWGEEYLGDDNAVKTHMSNLRNKLKKASNNEEYIETVWGLGYRLKNN